MNILVTGGLGHIGSFFLKNLNRIKNLKNIYVIDANFGNNFNSLFSENVNKKVNFYLEDILNFDFNKIKKIDYIIHLASHTNAENSLGKKKIYYENNFNIFKKICNVAKKKKSKLIHFSSTSIYGKSNSIVIEDIDEYLKPQSPYAQIKFDEEKFLKKTNLDYVTLRLGTISGVSPGIRFHTAVNKFCLNAVIGNHIPVWKTAMNQVRPYLSLIDAFNAVIFILNKDIFDKQIFNLVTDNLTVKNIISKIRQTNKKRLKINLIDSKIMNQLSYKVSRKKFEKRGFRFKGSVYDDIEDTINLFKNVN